MRRELDAAAATLLMRALLGRSIGPGEIERVGWERLTAIARQNGVLLRAAACFESARVSLPAAVADAIAAERQRMTTAVALVRRVGEICDRHAVPFIFPKALQHLPDVGSDLDLLVGTRSTSIDTVLIRELALTPMRSNLVSRVAGAAAYRTPNGPPLDIQHGRLGAVGEHVGFPAAMLAGRRTRVVDGMAFNVPSPDDQLVLQGMQRVYGRRRIRLSDIVYTIATVTRDALDWDYIVGQADRTGTLRGLGCYLSYADQVHRELVGYPLLHPHTAARFRLAGWGRLDFRAGYYRYPVVRVSARLYPPSLGAQLRAGNWTGAGRLCLVPLLGVASAFRRHTAASVAPEA